MFSVYLAVMIGSVIWSIYYTKRYSEEYMESPVLMGPLILQGSCLIVTLMNWPDPKVEIWFVIGLIATIASYAYGLLACWKSAIEITEGNTKEAKLAVLAQALLPTGVVLLVVFLVIMASGGRKSSGGSKR